MAEQRTARDVCSIEHVTGRERESDVELAPFHGKEERKKEGGRGLEARRTWRKGLFECRIGMEMKFSRFR